MSKFKKIVTLLSLISTWKMHVRLTLSWFVTISHSDKLCPRISGDELHEQN